MDDALSQSVRGDFYRFFFLVLIVAWPLYLVSIWTRALVTAAAVFVLYVIFRRQEYRLDKLEETCKTLEETIEKLREHPAGGDDQASAP